MDNTKKLFRAIKADAMLTSSEDLRAYLTGFSSSFGFVYTDAQESIFFTDPRYAEGAKKALKDEFIAVEIAKSEASVLDYIKSKKIKRLAVPLGRLTLPRAQALKKRRFRLEDSLSAFTAAMSVKSDPEKDCIARACSIAEHAFELWLGQIREGMTENEAAGLLEYLMRKCGASDRSFETIIAFGKNTAIPHHAPDATVLRCGMPVLADFGCRYGGYCSDMTRTFLFGKGEGQEDFARVYEKVLEAHLLCAEKIEAGMTGKAADAIARDHLRGYGLDKFFTHSLGHGIGINIHEFPTLGPNGADLLEDGMVFSIEPGVYFEGKFGIRIEDSVLLDGGVKSFMKTDKKLTVL